MKFGPYFLGTGLLGLVSCVSSPAIETTPDVCKTAVGEFMIRSGSIHIDHGDYLITDRGDLSGEEKLFLIRDDQYLAHVDYLDGSQVTLLLQPVDACDAEAGSSMAACIYLGKEGTAYKIAAWCNFRR